MPEVDDVQTHIEPLAEQSEGRPMVVDTAERDVVLRIVHDVTGLEPREIRFVRTDDGTIAYLTLGLDAASPLAEAHARASEIEERIRRARPDIADVIVHTNRIHRSNGGGAEPRLARLVLATRASNVTGGY